MKKLILVQFLFISLFSFAQKQPVEILSPGQKIKVQVRVDASGQATYTVHYGDSTVLEPSRLGITRQDGDFTKNLSLDAVSKVKAVNDNYRLFNAKRYKNSYTANRRVINFKNGAGQPMDIIFQVSDDGVAFRYYFPGKSADLKKIDNELTSFHFPADTRGWLQPMSKAKSGWEKVNPCYEEFYEKGIPAGTPPTLGAGWVFPALFRTPGNTWVLITEAAVDSNYCASKLDNARDEREYHIAFPDPLEIYPGGANKPQARTPWYSPWRIIAVGSLATIAESTLGTDLAPAAKKKMPFAMPGKSSWSWPILKDDSITYPVQKRFIDYAADMHWQYCLIDVNWDTKIGFDSIQSLINYAKQKKVGVWLWYNSAGSWNTTPYHPRSKLLTHEDRVREFSMLQKMGVAGIKVDFFGGDGQSMMKYYIDMMNDAAAYGLMVNFHGATLPRGWQRTFPNLMTAEAIKGFEYVTFDQRNADEEPAHCTVLPFTRNAFDPMDFTPMSLYRIPRIRRKTTAAFELALSVIFLSGVQHFAETPNGMSKMPEMVKKVLGDLPTHWDDVKFIDGFPGKYVILARKKGDQWWLAGINGESTDKEVTLDLSYFKAPTALKLMDGAGEEYFTITNDPLPGNRQMPVKIKAGGGFLIIL
jgi:alpha-glucosidase